MVKGIELYEMELSISDIITIAGWLLGGGSIGGVLTWRWTRRKEKAEAQIAEVNMAKEVQNTYQEMLRSKQEEVSDKMRIITELRQDRDHFRQDRNELRKRIDENDEKLRDLQAQVARNGRQIGCMLPMLCGRAACPDRINVTVSADGEVKPKRSRRSSEETNTGKIEPLSMKDL